MKASSEMLAKFHNLIWVVVNCPGSSEGKQSACNAGIAGSILGREGEGNVYPLYILAWEILWTKEPGRL